MPRIVSLADALKCDPKEQLPAVRGKVLKVGKYFSGQSAKGPWSFQTVTLEDGGTKADVKFKGRDQFDGSAVGKVMFVVAHNGERGLTGVRAEEDEYNGKISRIVLVTPSAEVTFGQGNWGASNDKPAAAAAAAASAPAGDPEPPGGEDYPGDDEPPAKQATPNRTETQPGKDGEWDGLKHEVNRIRKLHLLCCAAAAYNAHALHKAGISVGDEFLQATVATIFIEACKRGGVTSVPESGEPPVNFPKFDF